MRAELPKDWPEELPDDVPKDFPKELPKDFPKDFPFDPPPKGFFEPPIDFPFPGLAGGGMGPHAPGWGVPFVLATPAGGGGRQPPAGLSTLLGAYAQLLAQFARLHGRGGLDAAGMAAWQEAAAAYQRLLSGGGA
jgi:hypothetical protein